jgi:hypothetical protein
MTYVYIYMALSLPIMLVANTHLMYMHIYIHALLYVHTLYTPMTNFSPNYILANFLGHEIPRVHAPYI